MEQAVTDIFRTFGPWAVVLLATAWLLKVMVSDKLASIMDTLSQLVKGQANHSDRIVRMETIMNLNGCFEGDTPCRRKDDR